MKTLKLLLAGALLAGSGLGQTTPQSLLVTRLFNIQDGVTLECGAAALDNRSSYTRQNDYHAFYATGTGTWSVEMQYSDTACTGPWVSFGSAATVTQASAPAIGYGNGYHQFIRFSFSGANKSTVRITYSAAKNFYISASVGAVTFPITVAQGGSGLNAVTAGQVLFGGSGVYAQDGNLLWDSATDMFTSNGGPYSFSVNNTVQGVGLWFTGGSHGSPMTSTQLGSYRTYYQDVGAGGGGAIVPTETIISRADNGEGHLFVGLNVSTGINADSSWVPGAAPGGGVTRGPMAMNVSAYSYKGGSVATALFTTNCMGLTPCDNATIFEFDINNEAFGTGAKAAILAQDWSPSVGAPVFTGAGLNDLSVGGFYLYAGGASPDVYTVQIDGTGTPDTFRWRRGTGTWTLAVPITGAAQALSTTITAATNAAAAQMTAVGHGMPTTVSATISGFTGNWAAANGTHTITKTGDDTFTIPVDSTTFGVVTGAPVFTQGVTLTFAATTGHTLSNQWVMTSTSITSAAQNYAFGVGANSNAYRWDNAFKIGANSMRPAGVAFLFDTNTMEYGIDTTLSTFTGAAYRHKGFTVEDSGALYIQTALDAIFGQLRVRSTDNDAAIITLFDSAAVAAANARNWSISVNTYALGSLEFAYSTNNASPPTVLGMAITRAGLIQVAGMTAAYPALKRNATGIDFRLADDSNYAPIAASGYSVGAAALASTHLSDTAILIRNNDTFWELGGLTAAYPALKRNATGVDFRLADDSNYAPIAASGYSVGAAALASTHLNDTAVLIRNNDTFWELGGTTAAFPAFKRNATAVDIRLADDSGAAPLTAATLATAGANGQALTVQSLTELTTIAAGATTDTTIQIPANAIVLGVSVRVTTVIPTAATFTVIGATTSTAFQTGASVSTAAGTTDAGTKNCPYLNAAAQSIRITPNLVPGDNSGRVRVTIHYVSVTPPTS